MRKILKNKKKKGFTLIEMVAVVAIIGILAAILIPKVTGYMNEAKKTKVVDQARKVTQAVESARMKGKTIEDNTTLTDLTEITVRDFLDASSEANVGLLTEDGKTLQNLSAEMTVAQCKHVSEGKDFTINESGDDVGDFLATR